MDYERPVTKSELKYIHSKMIQYHRTDGWIALVGKKLEFFDSEPSTGGAYIELETLTKLLKFPHE